MRIRNVAAASAVAVALGVAATGCNSDDSGSSSDSIKVGIFATTSAGSANAFVEPWSVDGLKAAAKAINADGGVDGKHIEVVVCDNGGDPNKDAACARKAVTDKWVAVVGGFDPYAPTQTLPLLEAASIPYVGFLQVAPPEYQSKVSFPIEAGVIGGASGTAATMVADGCTKPAYIGSNDAGGQATADQLEKIFGDASVSYDGAIDFPPGTTDVTPIVASALAQDPDCLMFNGAGSDLAKIFAGVRKAGSDAKLYAATAVVSPDIIQTLGDDANGIRGASTAPLASSADPAMADMLADLKSYDPEAPPTEFTINAYFALKLVANELEGIDDVSSKALLDKLSETTDADAGPFGTIDFTAVRDSEGYPRLFNTRVWFSEITDGNWVTESDSADGTDIASSLP